MDCLGDPVQGASYPSCKGVSVEALTEEVPVSCLLKDEEDSKEGGGEGGGGHSRLSMGHEQSREV